MSVETKIESVYSELKKRIAGLDPGRRIPSVRDVVREFGVSLVTADRAMQLLNKEGLIVRRVGKGAYVTGKLEGSRQSKKYRLGISLPNYPSSFWDALIAQIVSHGREKEFETKVVRYEGLAIPSPSRDLADAMAVLLPGSDLQGEDIARLKNLRVPVVLLDRVLRGLAIDCVGTDNELGAALAADHLIKLNHRNLAILIAEPRTISVNDRVTGFCRQAHLAGIDHVQIFDCHTQPGENSIARGYDQINRLIQSRALNFTGLFVVSDGSVLGVMKGFQRARMELPARMSIVGFDDIPEAEYYHPSLTTVRQDVSKIAQAAVEILERRFAGDAAPSLQRAIPPRLIIRESTTRRPLT